MTRTIATTSLVAALLLTACSGSPVKSVDSGLYGIRVERNWVLSESGSPRQIAMERAERFCSGQGGRHAVVVKELDNRDRPNLIGEEFAGFRMLFECLPTKDTPPGSHPEQVLNRIYGL
ncbi:MAG TPA: hypothetical protein ENI96_12920 [Sedimenticola thiotaurini]|uniref:Uncharacterized protein n=1 Tax=Sedimenticola thiotaurini TaxID=1543721 RepID=A0A831RQD5_9GAMM|nr:hypothetical protein [Sedimenticola thiotaurini]